VKGDHQLSGAFWDGTSHSLAILAGTPATTRFHVVPISLRSRQLDSAVSHADNTANSALRSFPSIPRLREDHLSSSAARRLDEARNKAGCDYRVRLDRNDPVLRYFAFYSVFTGSGSYSNYALSRSVNLIGQDLYLSFRLGEWNKEAFLQPSDDCIVSPPSAGLPTAYNVSFDLVTCRPVSRPAMQGDSRIAFSSPGGPVGKENNIVAYSTRIH
jgi:hypothetical protein